MGQHLPWKHYYATLRSLLKLADTLSSRTGSSSEGAGARERLLFSATCSLLDAWHFDIVVSAEKEKEEKEERASGG